MKKMIQRFAIIAFCIMALSAGLTAQTCIVNVKSYRPRTITGTIQLYLAPDTLTPEYWTFTLYPADAHHTLSGYYYQVSIPLTGLYFYYQTSDYYFLKEIMHSEGLVKGAVSNTYQGSSWPDQVDMPQVEFIDSAPGGGGITK